MKAIGVLGALFSILVLANTANDTGNYAGVDDSLYNIDFATAVKVFYIAFQKIMPCGYAPWNMPVVAPYTVSSYQVNLTNEHCRLTGNIYNLTVTGLNQFYMVDFTFNATTNRTTYDLFFPEVKIIGDSQLDVWANWAGYPLTTTGKVLINVRVLGFRLAGNFVLGPSQYQANTLRVSDFNFNFYVGNLVANNWNRLWNSAFNNFVNEWLRSSALFWSQQVRDRVRVRYAPVVLPQLNGWLLNITMPDLIDILTDQGIQFNMAQCSSSSNASP